MHRKYLGDSYDAVKRMWQQILQPWAPLYAYDRFIPLDIRDDFTRLTGIEVSTQTPRGDYSLLNDPDTGVRLPSKSDQTEIKHVSIATISRQLELPGVKCVISFDQSNYRSEGALKGQRVQKLDALRNLGRYGFYYVSHAPFLFATQSEPALRKLRALIVEAGVPEKRLQ